MVIQDDPPVDLEILVLATVKERAHEDVAACAGGKDREAFEDRRGDEMRCIRVVDPIAAALCALG